LSAPKSKPRVLTEAQKAWRQEYRRNNLPAFRARQKAYRARNVEKCKELVRRSAYGLAEGQYEEMVREQQGVCAICGKQQAGGIALAVDHDHRCCQGSKACGKCIRGLLCNSCNTLLAYAKDDREVLEAAIRYLGRYAHA
jgi:hypothetical protein